MRRSSLAFASLLAGLVALSVAFASIRLDSSPALKALAVLPAILLLVAASLFAYPDVRRRTAASLVALGTASLMLAALGNATYEGWFQYSGLGYWRPEPMRLPLSMTPAFVVVGTLALPAGAALGLRGSVAGALLLGMSAWAYAGFPAANPASGLGMPRRYAYYYSTRDANADSKRKAVAAALLVLGTLLLTDGKGARRG